MYQYLWEKFLYTLVLGSILRIPKYISEYILYLHYGSICIPILLWNTLHRNILMDLQLCSRCGSQFPTSNFIFCLFITFCITLQSEFLSCLQELSVPLSTYVCRMILQLHTIASKFRIHKWEIKLWKISRLQTIMWESQVTKIISYLLLYVLDWHILVCRSHDPTLSHLLHLF